MSYLHWRSSTRLRISVALHFPPFAVAFLPFTKSASSVVRLAALSSVKKKRSVYIVSAHLGRPIDILSRLASSSTARLWPPLRGPRAIGSFAGQLDCSSALYALLHCLHRTARPWTTTQLHQSTETRRDLSLRRRLPGLSKTWGVLQEPLLVRTFSLWPEKLRRSRPSFDRSWTCEALST